MDIEVVLDCADLDRSTTFWSVALGYEHAGSAEQYSVLRDRDGRRPRLLLQRVDEPKTGKNRVHFDLTAPDIEGEAMRLEGLGARRVPDGHLTELGTEWIQMVDPEGNEFCVCKPFEDTSGRPVLGVRPALHRYVLDHAPSADPIAAGAHRRDRRARSRVPHADRQGAGRVDAHHDSAHRRTARARGRHLHRLLRPLRRAWACPTTARSCAVT